MSALLVATIVLALLVVAMVILACVMALVYWRESQDRADEEMEALAQADAHTITQASSALVVDIERYLSRVSKDG